MVCAPTTNLAVTAAFQSPDTASFPSFPLLRILVLVFGGQNRRNDLLKVYARTEVWVSYTFHGTPRALRVGALASIMQTSHRSGQRAYRAWLGTNADKVRSRSCRESKQED